jgi:glycosyltransferase involved in cell wall biosynthesis
MIIGFDAKRAFYNSSGLGNYSRTIINTLASQHSEHQYLLYTPGNPDRIGFNPPANTILRYPESFYDKFFKSYWRSFGIIKQLHKDNLNLFHGLSNELPKNIANTRIKSVVTIHDLIFKRYPELYKPVDRQIYDIKSRYSCGTSDKIIAISKQTKQDILEFYNINETKVEVIYQSCNPIFYNALDDEAKSIIAKKHKLPESFILSLGTIEERKNLLNIVKAMNIGQIDIPLIVIGRHTDYIHQVKAYISENNLEELVFFHHHIPTEDLPAIYQLASLFIYPSVFEGFGLPILESLNSGTPVITSKSGCFPEAGGKFSSYVDPFNPEEIAEAIVKILSDSILASKMTKEGKIHALNFREELIADKLIKIYQSL